MSAATESFVVSSPSDFAPKVSVSYPTLLATAVRAVYGLIFYENPLLWYYRLGRHNANADVEGPYYVLGAPSRQIDEGKAIFTSVDQLKKFAPYLLSVRVLTPDGDPIANATLDIWQADSDGEYSLMSYSLRGKATTDANGHVEILTVPPGMYGPQFAKRAGHIHVIIRPPKDQADKYNGLTTQIYICKGNDSKWMQGDFLNLVRATPRLNLSQSWSIASASNGTNYWDLPELSRDDVETLQKVQWWNKKLAEKVDGVQVVCGASVELKLSKKAKWF